MGNMDNNSGNVGVVWVEGLKGKNWDNCNSINNKILLKKEVSV